MKIYPRILLNTLPLIILVMIIVGGLNYYLSKGALANIAEKWLVTKVTDATRIASDNIDLLKKFGLDNISANVKKAQDHTGSAMMEISVGKSGFIWVVDRNGLIIIHPDPKLRGVSIAESRLFHKMLEAETGKKFHNSDGSDMLVVYAHFAPWNWYILASVPVEELYGETQSLRDYMLIVGFLVLFLTAIVLMVLASRLTAPLDILAKEAEQIGKGDLRQVTRLNRGDEIGTLSRAFSTMADQLNRQIIQEKLISDISNQFVYISEDEIDLAIRKSLEKIGRYTGADRCYIGLFSFTNHQVSQAHEWCRDGVVGQSENLRSVFMQSIPWLMQQLDNKGAIVAASLDDLPDEAVREKELWRDRELQSVVRVAMIYGGELHGFVGLDAITQPQPWNKESVLFLQRIGEIFCNALERQWYQEKLAMEKERLAVTLQSIGDGVITTDVEGLVVLINRVAEMLTGWSQEEAVGEHITSVFTMIDEESGEPTPPFAAFDITFDQQPAIPAQSMLLDKDGNKRLISSSVAPIHKSEGENLGYVYVFRDITQKRRMEEEMIRVEKLESVGVLAGGIAHDFNNILTAIIGNLSLAKHYIEPGSTVMAKMEEIEAASYRARDLTNQLLTFSKGGEPVKKPLLIDDLVYESAIFALGGSNIGLDYKRCPDILIVEADEGQISQVVNNLVINAVQAMPNGGVIQINTTKIRLRSQGALPLPAGEYVKLTLKDSGGGISKENLNQIFDPFFTTKSHGSGLGLASAYSIIEKHGGYITVESELGRGTEFIILLPASDKQAKQTISILPKLDTVSGRILVMDDEKNIRELAGNILSTIGYRVEFAEDGKKMLKVYEDALHNGEPFSAVLLDLTIPGGMGGKEAISHLLKIDDSVKAIVSSGYSNDPVMSDFRHYGFKAAVSKPYSMADLCSALSEVIGKN